MTRCRYLTISFVLILTSAHWAPAQTSVYGMATLTNYNAVSLPARGDSGGFSGGAFYNFPIQSRLTAGLDARASYSPGPEGGALGLSCLRIGFVPRSVRLRPYFQIGGGVVKATGTKVFHPSATQTISSGTTSGAAGFLFGLDIRLTNSLDMRAGELGAFVGPSGYGR